MNGPEEREHRMTFVLNYCSTAVLCRTTSLNALPTKHRIISAEVVRMVAQRRKGVGGGCRATRGGRHPCVRAVVCTCRCECITNSRRDNAESAPIFRYCSQFCSVSESSGSTTSQHKWYVVSVDSSKTRRKSTACSGIGHCL